MKLTDSGPGITRDHPNIQTPIRVDCELDKALLERTCTARYQDQFGKPAVHTQTVRYASLADFVDEAAPPGRVLAISVTVTGGRGQTRLASRGVRGRLRQAG